MNKCMRPSLGTKATEVNMVDQMPVFIKLTSKPFSFEDPVAQGTCMEFGDNKNKRGILLRSGSFAVVRRDSKSYEEHFFFFCKSRAWVEGKDHSK